MTLTLHHGDALEVLRGLADDSVDAVVTDPPYGLSDHTAADVAEALGCWLRGEEYQHRGGGFMSRSWDSWVPGPSLWREVFRVLKPGGHLLCFAGTRTQDLMGIAIRLAGFECRDTLQWLYGSGFPKSHDVSKAIDKAAGAEREVVGKWRPTGTARPVKGKKTHQAAITTSALDVDEREPLGTMLPITAPATDAARRHAGTGTALKPAHEPILVFRKPLVGTVAANVLAYGTGALNIAGCRVGTETTRTTIKDFSQAHGNQWGKPGITYPAQGYKDNPPGRWPPNVALSHSEGCQRVGTRRVKGTNRHVMENRDGAADSGSYSGGWRKDTRDGNYADADGLETVEAWACVEGCPVKSLAEQSGVSGGTMRPASARRRNNGVGLGTQDERFGSSNAPDNYGDTGTAARFFPNFEASPLDDVTPWLYTAKASRREREAGLEGMEKRVAGAMKGNQDAIPSRTAGDGVTPVQQVRAANHHPTVKPLSLMRWLVRLVTPPGGVVLDPFTGSGTTGAAAAMEGFAFIGIEREAEYLEIARRRIAWAVDQEPPLLRATGD